MQEQRNLVTTLSLLLLSVTAIMLFGCGPRQGTSVLPDAQLNISESFVVRKPMPDPYTERTLCTRSNIRAEPSTTSGIVATLRGDALVGLLGLEDGWYNVVADSVTGWIWAPLLNMTDADRWEAAVSYSLSKSENNSLFVAKYSKDRTIVIVLDISWRNLSDMRKLQIVSAAGEAWRRGCNHMGIDPIPEIRFMSNTEVQIAKWHAFWGPEVMY